MFRLLEKLDIAFASLLQGRDVESGGTLPGFETGRGVTGTERVRIKSVADNSRVAVVHLMSQENTLPEVERDDLESMESSMDEDAFDDDRSRENDFAMSVARVYDRTIVELGDQLGGNNNS